MVQLTPEQTGAVDACKEALIREFFQDEEFPERMVLATVPSSGEGVGMDILTKQHRDRFLDVHREENLDPNSQKFTLEAFRTDVLFSVESIQKKLADLYRRQLNPHGYMLCGPTDEDDSVRFEEGTSAIEKYIASTASEAFLS